MVEKGAFDDLFRQHYTELYLFAKRFVTAEADCEDIVSDAFEDVWRNLSTLCPDGVRAFLYKDVRNKCIDHLRRRSIRRQYAELMGTVTQNYDSADWLAELKEREHFVVQVLDSLPQYTRQIFTACYADRKRYVEVAQELGISVSTVKKYVSRALQLIGEHREKAKKY